MTVCESFEDAMIEYLHGRLGRREAGALLMHIAKCPDCRAELAELLAIKRLADASAVEASEEVARYAKLLLPKETARPDVDWMRWTRPLSAARGLIDDCLSPIGQVFRLAQSL